MAEAPGIDEGKLIKTHSILFGTASASYQIEGAWNVNGKYFK